MGDNGVRSVKMDEVRAALKQAMRPNQYYSSEELMAATGYDSRTIYRVLRLWKKSRLLRTRKRGETSDNEYRLVR